MTNWFASRSRWKTISPVSGHLIQRFCGTSRLLRRLRIFGRTTLLIQLKACLFLFCRLDARRAHALGELGDETGHRRDGLLRWRGRRRRANP